MLTHTQKHEPAQGTHTGAGPHPATLMQKKSPYTLRMCSTRSMAQLKPPSTASQAAAPAGASAQAHTHSTTTHRSNPQSRAQRHRRLGRRTPQHYGTPQQHTVRGKHGVVCVGAGAHAQHNSTWLQRTVTGTAQCRGRRGRHTTRQPRHTHHSQTCSTLLQHTHKQQQGTATAHTNSNMVQ
jgi:hypothetical protein